MKDIREQLYSMMEGYRNDLGRCLAGELQNGDGEPVDLRWYLDDAFDVDFRVDCYRRPIGCRVWLAVGGPTIWVDTEERAIVGAWGNDRETLPISEDLADAILEELW